MIVRTVIAQLRTRDLASSIRFYTTQLGLTLDFEYQDFYAGVRADNQVIHLKRVDEKDPSIDYVRHGEHFHLYFDVADVRAMASTLKSKGVRFLHDLEDKPWGTTEFAIEDDQGHTLYFGAPRS
jgi:catechol 2,3-dioxygenase-like lactoylglutathione lyase family enzyme